MKKDNILLRYTTVEFVSKLSMEEIRKILSDYSEMLDNGWRIILKHELLKRESDEESHRLWNKYKARKLRWKDSSYEEYITDVNVEMLYKFKSELSKRANPAWEAILNTEIREKIDPKYVSNIHKLYADKKLVWLLNPHQPFVHTLSTNNIKEILRNDIHKYHSVWRVILNMEIYKREAKDQEMVDKYKAGMLYWPSSEGPKRVQNMDSNHIKNCLDYLEKGKGGFGMSPKWKDIFKMELTKRSKKVEDAINIKHLLKTYKDGELEITVFLPGGNRTVFIQDLSIDQLKFLLEDYIVSDDIDQAMIGIFKEELLKKTIERDKKIKDIQEGIALMGDYYNKNLYYPITGLTKILVQCMSVEALRTALARVSNNSQFNAKWKEIFETELLKRKYPKSDTPVSGMFLKWSEPCKLQESDSIAKNVEEILENIFKNLDFR